VDTVLPERFFMRFLSRHMDKEDLEVRGKMISRYHDLPAARHPGVKHTLDLLLRNRHQWKGLRKDVQEYIKGCLVCQKTKPSHSRQANLLHLLLVPGAPWEAILWDLIRLLPESQTYNAISPTD
jgi:hypothetical protein